MTRSAPWNEHWFEHDDENLVVCFVCGVFIDFGERAAGTEFISFLARHSGRSERGRCPQRASESPGCQWQGRRTDCDWAARRVRSQVSACRNQVVNSSIEAERDHLRVAENVARVLTMKETITEIRPLVLDALLKISANFTAYTEWTPLAADKSAPALPLEHQLCRPVVSVHHPAMDSKKGS